MGQHPEPPISAPSPTDGGPDAAPYRGPERRYRRDDERFRTLLNKISDTVTVVSPRGRILYSTVDQLGGTLHLGFGDRFEPVPLSALHPDDLEHVAAAWTEVVENPGREVHAEIRIRRESGTWADVSAIAVNLVDDPAVNGVVITTRDVTALRRAERLAVSQATVLELIARGADLDAVLDACVELVASNGSGDHPAIHLEDGGTLELRAGREPPDPARTWTQPILRLGTETPLGILVVDHHDPEPPDDHRARVTHVACSLVAIAVDRLDNEARLTRLALHDPLTGLPNRTLLLDRLDHALARNDRPDGSGIAVLFCDLDDFKVVNDSLGHDVGDRLLAAVADRLRATVDPRDTVARFGGDEFVVLLEHVTDDQAPAAVADAIRRALEQPFELDGGQEFVVSTSIGLTTRSAGHAAADWLRDADAAMYRAKERGRNRTVVFDADMRRDALERLEVQRDLRRAVRDRRIVLFYQPLVDLRTGAITGVEALARWHHPERGLLAPDHFIGVAEEHGLIEELGYHILDLALADAPSLAAASGADDFRISVNVSAHQLDDPHLDELVHELCHQHRWSPSQLVLEITETALTREVERPLRLLERLQDLGVRIAIDDFGTGYSSLARLGRLLVDQVKLDRTFVAAIDDPTSRLDRLVDAVVAIGDRLGIEVVGEGVETPAQLDGLRATGCTHAQGYLFATPAPHHEVAELLAAGPTW